MFDALDIDNTGFIPVSEIMLALEKLGIKFDNPDVLDYIIEITD